jgi:hypothetical protein
VTEEAARQQAALQFVLEAEEAAHKWVTLVFVQTTAENDGLGRIWRLPRRQRRPPGNRLHSSTCWRQKKQLTRGLPWLSFRRQPTVCGGGIGDSGTEAGKGCRERYLCGSRCGSDDGYVRQDRRGGRLPSPQVEAMAELV